MKIGNLWEADALADKRREEIRLATDVVTIAGTAYYVSASGNDANDGRTPDSAWRTLRRVSEAVLLPGDGVFFCRGDIFRGWVDTKRGVTYGAYGTGEKPRFYGWIEDMATPSLWTLADEAHHIWQYAKKILDVGTIIFDDGQAHSRKLIPSYLNGRFVCRDEESRPFVMSSEMTDDLDLYWHYDDRLTCPQYDCGAPPVPAMDERSYGTLYLRCDRGNPGEVFNSIEALPRQHMFVVADRANVHLDNLCLKYIGCHAVAAYGHVVGLCVTNCEIGWIGGCIQHYAGTDPNFPEGGRGSVTRYGNAVEIYGGCEDFTVSNCYIYQVYDAGITHQVTTDGRRYVMQNVLYENNLVERCVYGIEYFLNMTAGDTESLMRHIVFRHNLLRLSGYGWGQQRHNKHTPAHIKGWDHANAAEDFVIESNILDRSAYRMVHLVAKKDAYCPVLSGNTYIQYRNGMLGERGGNEKKQPELWYFDENAEKRIREAWGDITATLIYAEEGE